MNKTYRVIVTEEWRDEDGEYQSSTIFEAASTNTARLAYFAPAEVAEALGVAVPLARPIVAAPEPAVAAGADVNPDPRFIPADGVVQGPVSAPEAAPAKRKRRTKAEMAAARAAEAADGSVPASATSDPATVATAPENAAQAPADAPTFPWDAPSEAPVPASPATPEPTEQAPAGAWNPFGGA